MTPLLWGVHGRHDAVVGMLLDRGANANCPPEATGWSPLAIAAEWGSSGMVSDLLDHGADWKAVLPSGERPIHVAARHHRAEIVALLVNRGDEWDQWSAAAMGRLDLLEQIAKLDPAAINRRLGGGGSTPLEFAAAAKQAGVVDWLIERGAELDAMSAIRLNRLDYVRERAGREKPGWIDASGSEGIPALHQAIGERRHDAIRFLVECGARLDLRDGRHDATPLDWARYVKDKQAEDLLMEAERKIDAVIIDAAISGDAQALAKWLKRYPKKIQITGGQWDQPLLHLAARGGHLQAVNFLLGLGFDVNRRDKNDNAYALHFTAGHGHLAVVQRLVEAGADIHGDGDNHQLGVLGWATCFGQTHEETALFLLEHGARFNIFSAIALNRGDVVRRLVRDHPAQLEKQMSRNEHHRTPLHHAVAKNRAGMVELLIELGADVNRRDAAGMTPSAYATESGVDEKIIERLRAAGADEDFVAALATGDYRQAETMLQGDPSRIAPGGIDERALHFMVARRNSAAVRWLIDHGANVNDKHVLWACNATALHICAEHGIADIAAMLLNAGADPQIRDDKYDATALGWAQHCKRPQIEALLKDWEAK